MVDNGRIYLAILNITSWSGQCSDAEHVYGKLILSIHERVTIDNIEDWNVKYLGENIEIFRPITLDIAKSLDKKDGGNLYQKALRYAEENPEHCITNRFNTFEEVVNSGIKKWKELNIDCPFISLYEGKKYKSNSYEPSSTVILQYNNEH